ncbi:MAG TPA: ABC transporter ATP-binding protein [Tepidisphaeraceae bacterium]|jgi:simple sugar transport system ATP-binding protein|nr:ABC transporter ATP-binding protein [Tepidisphaeraceae bacterium]
MPSIELHHIVKSFGSVRAVNDVSMTIAPGMVHGVLGENGAGKTTLMNILYGMVQRDGGDIRIDARPVDIHSPRDAIAHGIGMVHQHFMLAGAMSVLDNVLLGDQRESVLLDRASAAKRLVKLAKDLNLEVDPAARVEELSVGRQQRVEILKALWREVNLLILDEPTAVLTPQETEQLFVAVRRLRSRGKSVVFISHKLREVLSICDRLAVLRAGRVVWEGSSKDASEERLASIMVGEDFSTSIGQPPVGSASADAKLLRVVNICAPGLNYISFDLRNEILGIAGVDGNGQQELAEAIIGLRPLDEGQILVLDRDISTLDARGRFQLGLAHIPNDRKHEGLIGSMGIGENLVLKQHSSPPFSTRGIMHWRRVRESAASLVDQFDIRTASLETPISTLSGGNQQKVVLARELGLSRPKVIIAMNPTRGLDVAATRFVHEQLLAHRARGAGIVLISSELDEILQLSDRVGVLYRGRLTMSDFPRDGIERIGRLMAGLAD